MSYGIPRARRPVIPSLSRDLMRGLCRERANEILRLRLSSFGSAQDDRKVLFAPLRMTDGAPLSLSSRACRGISGQSFRNVECRIVDSLKILPQLYILHFTFCILHSPRGFCEQSGGAEAAKKGAVGALFFPKRFGFPSYTFGKPRRRSKNAARFTDFSNCFSDIPKSFPPLNRDLHFLTFL